MRRLFLLLLCIGICGAAGCAPQASLEADYYVLFEKAPRLVEDGVYLQGMAIGAIQKRAVGPLNQVRFSLAIEPAFRERMKDNAAFFVSAGRLQYTLLESYGEILPPGAGFLGFTSKAGLMWFKTRHLMGPRRSAAQAEAARLAEFFNS